MWKGQSVDQGIISSLLVGWVGLNHVCAREAKQSVRIWGGLMLGFEAKAGGPALRVDTEM